MTFLLMKNFKFISVFCDILNLILNFSQKISKYENIDFRRNLDSKNLKLIFKNLNLKYI